ncbi:MAG: Hsp20/alpha crystallin family protein, partial [Spirochaetaceae bacterium]|nr:Hsp20/alpha crystallin family protein [Spirochaetaceae bacterium]MCF7952327.1 Hsp20/alpha crystallin family protein [Spirochaetaceae bacterium]
MRYMVHYNPKKNYDKGLYDFDTMLNNLFGTVNSDSRRSPAVDVIENENSYIIEAEVPGYSQEEIDVQVENSVLTISASQAGDQADQEQSQ